jgi:membrane dipeptidase
VTGCPCAAPGSRRAFLASLLGVVAAACAGPSPPAASRRQADLLAQGQSILGRSPVVDLHAHPGGFVRSASAELPLAALADMQAGGVHAAFFAAVGDAPVIRLENNRIFQFREPRPGELRRVSIEQLGRVLRRVKEEQLELLWSPADLTVARYLGRPAALLALEGGDGLEGNPRLVKELHEVGVRSIQLVHYRINELGDIQTERPRHGGLTPAGQDVVAEMNRLGMIVDGAHASADTLRGILAASRHPIIVSHTAPARLRSYQRHLPDELIRAVAARGGIVGVWPLATAREGPEQFFRDLDYLRRLVGIDHVGVGTDMAGLRASTSLPTHRHLAVLPAALLARGFSAEETRKILGGNFLRLYESVARAS